jgi:membrane-associated protease RseP (regulator of RpoE activity)
MNHYGGFLGDFRQTPVAVSYWNLAFGGLWYSLTILAILGAHEMGHYLACRFYRIDASLPYFIPLPPDFFIGFLTGTLGAVIRIRAPFINKAQLFDVGVAGPIAGFLVAVPALIWGIAMSRLVVLPERFIGLELGEPLLFQLAIRLVWGVTPEGYSLNMHPMAFAAWFGLFATMFNLVPFGQLDGGHIAYAVFGRRARHIYVGAAVACVGLVRFSLTWVLLAALMILVLFLFGPQHPPVLDESVTLDRSRRWVAAFALLMFLVCFTPAPIQFLQLIPPR